MQEGDGCARTRCGPRGTDVRPRGVRRRICTQNRNDRYRVCTEPRRHGRCYELVHAAVCGKVRAASWTRPQRLATAGQGRAKRRTWGAPFDLMHCWTTLEIWLRTRMEPDCAARRVVRVCGAFGHTARIPAPAAPARAIDSGRYARTTSSPALAARPSAPWRRGAWHRAGACRGRASCAGAEATGVCTR